MAYVARKRTVSGLYGWLLEREESRVARWACRDGSKFPYPKHRVEALRSGLPVEVSGHEVNIWRRGYLEQPVPRRVVVEPDGRVRVGSVV